MPTQLLAPTDVAVTVSSTGITVSWKDPNATATPKADATKYKFTVSVVNRDGLTPLSPPMTVDGVAPTTAGDVTAPLLAYAGTLGQTDFPSPPSKYLVKVVAVSTDVATYTDSPAAYATYYENDFALTIEVAGRTFTLTSLPHAEGIYTLVSSGDPVTITWTDITNFAHGAPLNLDLPTTLLGKDLTTMALTVNKLAVDIDRKLFTFGVKLTLDQSLLIPGLSIQSVSLDVMRTDGVNTL